MTTRYDDPCDKGFVSLSFRKVARGSLIKHEPLCLRAAARDRSKTVESHRGTKARSYGTAVQRALRLRFMQFIVPEGRSRKLDQAQTSVPPRLRKR
jgi:hypothetical protein